MATGPKKGLNPSRQLGSGVDNKGLNSYAIASGYATLLTLGDPVKLVSGVLNKATNDTADAVGVFKGVSYTDSVGDIKFSKIWPASTVATNIEALVIDSPGATFRAVGGAAITSVAVGDIYAMTLTAGDTSTGQSNAVVDITTGVVAASLGMVKVVRVVDVATKELEVMLVDHEYRDNG